MTSVLGTVSKLILLSAIVQISSNSPCAIVQTSNNSHIQTKCLIITIIFNYCYGICYPVAF